MCQGAATRTPLQCQAGMVAVYPRSHANTPAQHRDVWRVWPDARSAPAGGPRHPQGQGRGAGTLRLPRACIPAAHARARRHARHPGPRRLPQPPAWLCAPHAARCAPPCLSPHAWHTRSTSKCRTLKLRGRQCWSLQHLSEWSEAPGLGRMQAGVRASTRIHVERAQLAYAPGTCCPAAGPARDGAPHESSVGQGA